MAGFLADTSLDAAILAAVVASAAATLFAAFLVPRHEPGEVTDRGRVPDPAPDRVA